MARFPSFERQGAQYMSNFQCLIINTSMSMFVPSQHVVRYTARPFTSSFSAGFFQDPFDWEAAPGGVSQT